MIKNNNQNKMMKKIKNNNKISLLKIKIVKLNNNNNNQWINNLLPFFKRKILAVEFLENKYKIHKFYNNHNNNHKYNNHRYLLNQIKIKISQKKKQINSHFDSLIYIYILLI